MEKKDLEKQEILLTTLLTLFDTSLKLRILFKNYSMQKLIVSELQEKI